jgi:hypothetical protein
MREGGKRHAQVAVPPRELVLIAQEDRGLQRWSGSMWKT